MIGNPRDFAGDIGDRISQEAKDMGGKSNGRICRWENPGKGMIAWSKRGHEGHQVEPDAFVSVFLRHGTSKKLIVMNDEGEKTMKLILCGKGGSGKSTIAALLAKQFAKEGKKVLVIDTDESNFGLHRQLGIELPQDFMNYFGGKKAVTKKIMGSKDWGAVQLFEEKWGLKELPADYVKEKDGISLVAIGKIHEAGEGCACMMGMTAKQFIENLQLETDEVVITDTEAGIEHFGRSVDRGVDAILMIVDPSYESIKLSEKVAELSGSLGKPVFFILNKVDGVNEPLMRAAIDGKQKIISAIAQDGQLALAGLEGNEIHEEYEGIEALCGFLNDHVK